MSEAKKASGKSNRIEKQIPRTKQSLAVLVVDDEKLIVQVGSAMLKKMG